MRQGEKKRQVWGRGGFPLGKKPEVSQNLSSCWKKGGARRKIENTPWLAERDCAMQTTDRIFEPKKEHKGERAAKNRQKVSVLAPERGVAKGKLGIPPEKTHSSLSFGGLSTKKTLSLKRERRETSPPIPAKKKMSLGY